MSIRSKIKVVVGCILILFILACALPSAATTPPSSVTDALSGEHMGTAIAETAAVAQTRTAAALPPTLTPTLTREPTSTFIAQPATPTPFFMLPPGVVLETLDPTYAATLGISGLGPASPLSTIPYTGLPWTCIVRSTSPKGGMIQPETPFYANWTVINTGTKPWTSTTVDFVFKSGYENVGRNIQDLPSLVASGRSITFSVNYVAPKRAGFYTSIWMLQVGNRPFCGMKMFFEVPKKDK